jgi:hypothetical protein
VSGAPRSGGACGGIMAPVTEVAEVAEVAKIAYVATVAKGA